MEARHLERRLCTQCNKFTYLWTDEEICSYCKEKNTADAIKEEIKNGEEPYIGMDNYIFCPYCGDYMTHSRDYFELEDYYVDGEYEHQCRSCGETYILTTSVSISYETSKKEDDE